MISDLRQSARLYFKGPAWTVAAWLSGLMNLIAVVEWANGNSVWFIAWLGSMGLVLATFFSFHRRRLRSGDATQMTDVLGHFALVGESFLNQQPRPESRILEWQARAREFLMDAYGPGAIALSGLYEGEGEGALPEQIQFFKSLLDDTRSPKLPLRFEFEIEMWLWVVTVNPAPRAPSAYTAMTHL